MKSVPALSIFSAALLVSTQICLAADAPAPAATPAAATPAATPTPPPRKITPGKAIVPTEKMRRIWGELVSMDLEHRTGKFRNETNDQIMEFNVLPYAELLHHAAFGDLQDFKIGTRGIFRLHVNDKEEWTWLTYIQDEMNFLNGHKEYYYVDKIDPEKGELECTDANGDKSYIREKGIIIKTDSGTRYWKEGEPAKFSDIQIGDKLRTSTHGIGKGRVRVCWEVFLDEASLQKFQNAQKDLEKKRLAEEGAPGYVDQADGKNVALTLFWESNEVFHQLKVGDKVRVAGAGADRVANTTPIVGTVTSTKSEGPLGKVGLSMDADATGLVVGNIARLWPVQ